LELTREIAERVNNLYGGRKWKKLGGWARLFLFAHLLQLQWFFTLYNVKYIFVCRRGGSLFKVCKVSCVYMIF
jgi:hypothetical protein